MTLLVLEVVNKRANAYDSEAQVIAGAVVAFQSNNKRRRYLGLNPLDAMTIPCITMTGTRPDFYLVPVTTALNDAVITGQLPATQTEVLHCPTEVAHTGGVSVGMENTEYRKVALQHLLAFKELAKNYWAQILEGVEVTFSLP